jgi:hypothetical protein
MHAATLLNNAGAGRIEATMNKAAAGNDASLRLQDRLFGEGADRAFRQ